MDDQIKDLVARLGCSASDLSTQTGLPISAVDQALAGDGTDAIKNELLIALQGMVKNGQDGTVNKSSASSAPSANPKVRALKQSVSKRTSNTIDAKAANGATEADLAKGTVIDLNEARKAQAPENKRVEALAFAVTQIDALAKEIDSDAPDRVLKLAARLPNLIQQVHEIATISGDCELAAVKKVTLDALNHSFEWYGKKPLEDLWREIVGKSGGGEDDKTGELPPEQLETRLGIIEPAPFAEPVDGLVLANEIRQDIEDYIFLPEGASTVITLWIFHTYTMDQPAMSVTPRLALTSSHKRSGKTTLGEIVVEMCRRPVSTCSLTEAVYFRLCKRAGRPTVFVDERDTALGREGDIEGIFNAGWRRKGAVLRCHGDDHDPVAFGVFAPIILAGIQSVGADTLEDRSFVIDMRRKLPGEQTKEYSADLLDGLIDKRARLMRWAEDNGERLNGASPTRPAILGLNDRAWDNWRILYRIARALGGAWTVQLDQALDAMFAVQHDEDDLLTLVLVDIHELSEARARKEGIALYEVKWHSPELIEKLRDHDSDRWAEFEWKGRPRSLTASLLATILKPVKEIRTKRWRKEGGKAMGKLQRGYKIADFEQAFERYVLTRTLEEIAAEQTHEIGDDEK